MDQKRYRIASYELGDMTAIYTMTGSGQPELSLFPAEEGFRVKDEGGNRQLEGECLVQAKLLGDAYPGAYAGGTTMRNSETVRNMIWEGQKLDETAECITITSCLRDGRNCRYIHTLKWVRGEYSLESSVRFENNGPDSVTLEMLSSFSMRGFTAIADGDGCGRMKLHRIRSRWSAEGRLVTETPEEMQLERSWSGWSVNSVRYGQAGSMPVKGYFPFGAVEDVNAQVVWAAQLAVESSWQMEFYRRDDDLAFSGGLADREFGHWMKTIRPGESFETPRAILTVVKGCLDEACQRLTFHGKKYQKTRPESEEHLPVLFNEYCTTWGLPSHENIHGILRALEGHGIEYFVMDCGWFVEEGKSWGDGMGDYVPSPKLFPRGLGALTEEIREAGMKPGIWFEIDNVGKDARAYRKEEMLLKRDGIVLTTDGRRFFDMRKKEVIAYLTEKVIGQLRRYGFSYIKIDYNDTIGIGCDGADSLGEGLRQDREASVEFVRKIRREVPGIIIENCASGGHRLESGMMSICSMASFSDAHEAEEIPVIALNLHRTILPAQSQIWAVIRKKDSLRRIAYTMANTFLGRMCLSGDVTDLSVEQWKQIDDAIAFYRQIAPVIKDGYSFLYENRGGSLRHLSGWQALVRLQTEEGAYKWDTGRKEARSAYVVVHYFGAEEEAVSGHPAPGPEGGTCPAKEIIIPLPEGCPKKIALVYKGTDSKVRVEDGSMIVNPDQPMEAVAVYLRN